MKSTGTTETPRRPDGVMRTQTGGKTIVFEVFFNHDSTETFQDKLMRVILAEDIGELLTSNNNRRALSCE